MKALILVSKGSYIIEIHRDEASSYPMEYILLTPSRILDALYHLITKNNILPRIRIYWNN